MTAWYNEPDPIAAQWLRNLIAAGHIADGVVDERSIEDVRPAELMGYRQCHFFAGIGIWSYALRQAGWPDDKPVWTGSCPCQPFSAAGKGAGFTDERHLWPAWHWLIQQCRPECLFGEQVASKAADPWIDLVQADLEAMGYAFGCVPFPAASVGAPHIRDRAYWLANSEQHGDKSQASTPNLGKQETDRSANRTGGCSCISCRMGNASNERLSERVGIRGISSGTIGAVEREAAERTSVHIGRMADTNSDGFNEGCITAPTAGHRDTVGSNGGADRHETTGATNGFWRAADWLFCRDGKWRPVEPGTFPLAHGIAGRVGRLRAFGNAICAPQAIEFIKATLDT